MINFFTKWKIKRDLQVFENQLVTSLGSKFNDLANMNEHWSFGDWFYGKDESEIHISHQTLINNEYTRHLSHGNGTNYRIEGLTIKRNLNESEITFTVVVLGHLISTLKIDNFRKIRKDLDFNSIDISKITVVSLGFNNPDSDSLLEILNNIEDDYLKYLEVEYCIEIELDGVLYYTIIDMEDGNYIAVDKQGKVYRLIHDHECPLLKIAETVQSLNFCGNKLDLEIYLY